MSALILRPQFPNNWPVQRNDPPEGWAEGIVREIVEKYPIESLYVCICPSPNMLRTDCPVHVDGRPAQP